MVFQKEQILKCSMKQKIHMQKRYLTRENIVEFSILFIMIFYGGAVQNNQIEYLRLNFQIKKMKN